MTKKLPVYFSDDAWSSLQKIMGQDGQVSPTINQLLESITTFNNFKQVIPSTIYHIPLALESIPTGFPSPAADYVEDFIDLNKFLISNPNATFLNRIRTPSMIDAGLALDDVIVIDRSAQPKHTSIVVALIDNKDLTIKRLMISSHMSHEELSVFFGENYDPATIPSSWLKAENPAFSNIYPSEEQTIQICAVVTWNLRNMLNQ